MTALMTAVRGKIQLGVIKKLIDAGADVNARSDGGNTVLMYAVRHRGNVKERENFRLFTELIKAGADVNAKDDSEKTVKKYLLYDKSWDALEKLSVLKLLEWCSDMKNALLTAIHENAGADYIRILISLGADINAKDEYGRTPVMLAALKDADSKIIVSLALEARIKYKKNYTDYNIQELYKSAKLGDFEALSLLRILAEFGNAEAQYNLGLMYDKGIGRVRNTRTAAYWFGKAAEKGYDKAQVEIGLSYQTGIGATPSLTERYKFY